MTRDQEALFAMFLKVRNFYTKNTAGLEPVPSVEPFFLEVKSKIDQLIQADAGGRSDVSGYAVAKAIMRQQLEMLALKVSNGLASYAVVNSDHVLQKKADFTTSSWYKFSEEELVTQAVIVKNLAVPLSASLGEFGATAADVEMLGTVLNSFTDAISDPSLAIDQRKNDNLLVEQLLDGIRTVLNDKLDVLMRSFQVNNGVLYDLYLSARAIDVNGSIMRPMVAIDVQPTVSATVFIAPVYSANQLYTLQNLGTEAVFFSLSIEQDVAGIDEVMLSAGETRSRLAENLSPSGTFLIVRNPNLSIAKMKIWVE